MGKIIRHVQIEKHHKTLVCHNPRVKREKNKHLLKLYSEACLFPAVGRADQDFKVTLRYTEMSSGPA